MSALNLVRPIEGKFKEPQKVQLASLSDLTGFPVEFIKRELVLESEAPTVDELRRSMLTFLNNTLNELNRG